MSTIKPKILTDQWVTATWDEYIQIADDPAYEKAKGYYHNGQMRIEIAALGHDHTGRSFTAKSPRRSIASSRLVIKSIAVA